MRLKTEIVDMLQGLREQFQQQKVRQNHSAIEEIDAFVMAHTTLEPGEFFHQLRQLDAWRIVSA